MADEIIRILSIDGGGIRGIIPARLLQFIEESIGKPATALFHLIDRRYFDWRHSWLRTCKREIGSRDS